MAKNEGITNKLITELASGATQESAAASAGCSKATVARRLRDPDFRRRVSEARHDHMRRSIDRLTAGGLVAATVLIQIAGDRDAPASARVAAAGKVLELGYRGVELLDVETRLADLQAAVAALEGRRRPGRLYPVDGRRTGS